MLLRAYLSANRSKSSAEREGKEPYCFPCLFSRSWARRVGKVQRIFHRMIWVILNPKNNKIESSTNRMYCRLPMLETPPRHVLFVCRPEDCHFQTNSHRGRVGSMGFHRAKGFAKLCCVYPGGIWNIDAGKFLRSAVISCMSIEMIFDCISTFTKLPPQPASSSACVIFGVAF